MVSRWMTVDDISMLYGKKNANLLRDNAGGLFSLGFDQVDALAWAVRMTLSSAAPKATHSGGTPVERVLSWRDKLLDSATSRAHLSHMAS